MMMLAYTVFWLFKEAKVLTPNCQIVLHLSTPQASMIVHTESFWAVGLVKQPSH